MKKNVLCIVLALALLLAVIPVSAVADAPAGYNTNEYEKIHAFLETADENGVKNGFKISDEYVADDPMRWGTYYDWIEEDEYDCFLWQEVNGEMRIVKVICNEFDLVGELDVSGFTELSELDCSKNLITSLNVAGCPKLTELTFLMNPMHGSMDLSGSPLLYGIWGWDAGLTGLDITGCTELELLYIEDNPELGSVDLSSCAKLDTLQAYNCGLTTVDLSCCPLLVNVDLTGNPLTDVNASGCTELKGGHIHTEGEGSFGYCWYSWNEGFVVITDYEDPENFIGWFDGTGALITAEVGFDLADTDYTEIVAKFNSGAAVLGDADANGEVNANDALAVLRFALGMISQLPGGACDVDGNGEINANDALYILRYVLGAIGSFPA